MNYLRTSFDTLQKHFPVRVTRPYKDGVGEFCLDCARGKDTRFLYVAKNSTLNGLVSVHKSIIELSAKHGLQIVLCVMGSYYKFYGSQVLAGKQFENEYNDAPMINFYLHKIGAERINLPGEVNPISGLLPKSQEQLRMMFQ